VANLGSQRSKRGEELIIDLTANTTQVSEAGAILTPQRGVVRLTIYGVSQRLCGSHQSGINIVQTTQVV